MINIYYALEKKTLEKYWTFRDAENRIKKELTSERIGEIRAAVNDNADSKPLYKSENGVANISIEGILTPQRTLSASLFGEVETVYTDIGEATLQADEDPLISSIAYHVNSPGGNWDGLDLAAQIIADAKKPSIAYVYSMAASAAYYLASQAGKIVAVTRGTQTGSIGVAAEIFDHSVEDNKKGIKRIVITNDGSEDKRPDPTTEGGYSVIKDELNDIFSIFEERVIEGRTAAGVEDFTADNILALKGRVVTAKKALTLGLIDEVQGAKKKTGVAGKNILVLEGKMDLSTFLKDNPEAKVEQDTLIAQAKADGKAEAMAEAIASVTAEKEKDVALAVDNTLKIVSASGVKLNPEAEKAAKEMQSAGDYALGVLKVGQSKAPKDNTKIIGGASAAHQLSEDAPTDAEKKAALDKKAAEIVASMPGVNKGGN